MQSRATRSRSRSTTGARSSSSKTRTSPAPGPDAVRAPRRSVEPDALPAELRLEPGDVQPVEGLVVPDREGRGDARALAADRAAHHVPGRRVGDLVAADRPARDDEVCRPGL